MSRRLDEKITIPTMYSIGGNKITYNQNTGPYSIQEAAKCVYEQNITTFFSDYKPTILISTQGEGVKYKFNIHKQEGTNADYTLIVGYWVKKTNTDGSLYIELNNYNAEPDILVSDGFHYQTSSFTLNGSDSLVNPVTLYIELENDETEIFGVDCWQSGSSRTSLPSGTYDCGINANLVFSDVDTSQPYYPLSAQKYYEVASVLNYSYNATQLNIVNCCSVGTNNELPQYFYIRRPIIPKFSPQTGSDLIVHLSALLSTSGVGQFTGTIDGIPKSSTYSYGTDTYLTFSVDSWNEQNSLFFTGSYINRDEFLNLNIYWDFKDLLK